MSGKKEDHKESIAIIGAACRFPGNVHTLDEFWQLLEYGTDAVGTITADRFSVERFCTKATNYPGHAYTTCAGVIPDIKEFDPAFFGISRKEAMAMDPQQRMALEMSWEALESSHIRPSMLKGSATAVFMGASNMDSSVEGQEDPGVVGPYSMTGSTLGIIANRISYYFDLHGPSMIVDTACSSSLVAVHLACEAIRSGSAELALAGGVNAVLAPVPFIGFSRAHMLSPDGRCKVFDASGNGYVRSEGGGVILLKSLARAQKDGDNILAVIAGSGVNSDGRTTGIALPNQQAQETLLRHVYAAFDLDIRNLVYVEAHGTGTAAGDPLEAGAIGNILGKQVKGIRVLPVGSVKSNIGHLEPASGIAGLIKSLLILQHNVIPPNLHFHTPNPAIDFEGLNISVPTALEALGKADGEEMISINSFGFGGTNAHVVLRRAPLLSVPRQTNGQEHALPLPPLFLSARSEHSLRALAGKYADEIEQADVPAYYDLAATLALDHDTLELRSCFSGHDLEDLKNQLRKFARGDAAQTHKHSECALVEGRLGTVFVFSGNGSQWLGMGHDLYNQDPVFKASLDEVDLLMARHQDWSILDILRHPEEHKEDFDLTERSQPLLFAIQVGLVRALEARGIRPEAVMGHSVGEVAAAWACGALSLEDAVLVIYYRSYFQAPFHNKGGMAVASADAGRVAELIRELGLAVEIAACNTSSSLTLSGSVKDLKVFVEACKARRIAARMLAIHYPFHTVLMNSFRKELGEALHNIKPRQPLVPFYSTALPGTQHMLPNADYWWQNIRRPVMFAEAARQAWDAGFRHFLEIGPSPVLKSYLRDMFRAEDDRYFAGVTLNKGKPEGEELDKSWKMAWQSGCPLDMRAWFPVPHERRALPSYCWEHEYLWEETTSESRSFKNPPRLHPLLGWALPGNSPVFENTIHLADYPWLGDHVAGSGAILPAAVFIETMLAAATQVYPNRTQQELEWVSIFRPLPLSTDSARVTRVSVDREDGGLIFEARPYLSAENYAACARARIATLADSPSPMPMDLSAPESFGREVDKGFLYASAKRFSLHYGPCFQTVNRAWIQTDGAYSVLARFEDKDPVPLGHMLASPTLLDGAFQTLFLLLGALDDSQAHTCLPSLFERVTLVKAGRPAFALARLERVSPRSVTASFRLMSKAGETLLELRNCRFRRAAWLEHEHAPARPYVMDLLEQQHPALAGNPVVFNLDQVSAKLSSLLAEYLEREHDALASMPFDPYVLLQFASVQSAYEGIAEFVCSGGLDRDASFQVADLIRSGVLAEDRAPWLRALLERLEYAGLARRDQDRWSLSSSTDRPEATTLWRTLMSSASGYLPEASLLAQISRQTGDLLRGNTRPEKNHLLDAYFMNSLRLQPYAGAIRSCLELALAEKEAAHTGSDPLHILQLARNTEGVLSLVMPLLDHRRCRYVVGEKDDSTAEAHSLLFNHNPALSFAGINPEAPDQEQLGRYNLIIVAYALHPHLNSAAALAGCLDMLAPGGLLCFVEHAPTPFTDLVFGANPAWWDASGNAELPVSLMQSSQSWQDQLLAAGCSQVRILEQEAESNGPAFVLLAQKSEESAPASAEAAREAEHWVLVTDTDGSSARLGRLLAGSLEEKGESTRLLAPQGSVSANACGDSFDAQNKDSWRTLFQAEAKRGTWNLVYALGYDNRNTVDSAELDRIQSLALNGLTAFAQVWEESRPKLKLWVLAGGGWTDSANSPDSPDSADAKEAWRPLPSQGALCGFTRVMMNEMRALPVKLLDAHGEDCAALIPGLLRELLSPVAEPEVALGAVKRAVPRMQIFSSCRVSALENTRSGAQTRGEEQAAILAFDEPGRLQNLYWKKCTLPVPGEGQVCVRVSHTGLNFRDVMWSMGLLQDEALENGFSGPTMGIECSGVIASLGEGVTDWRVGDAVVCFAPACFGSHVLTRATALARKPESMGFAEAATIPVTFITAWYSLKHLARMRRGERVLIHGAAGGVGLAALQIASLLGLEIYATAGSPEKHAFLRQLGVKNLYSSRSTAFAPQIMADTHGEGVDAVLNSLAGEYISAGLSVLRPFGRFLELGKRDFYADTPMRLRPFSNNLSYFGVDVDQLIVHQPLLAQELFTELMDLFREKKLAPLPHTVYPACKAVDAFQVMQQASHIGKLVVAIEGVNSMARETENPLRGFAPRKNASYLISGGTNGFGLAAAHHLAENGAEHLILLSRNGVREDDAKKVVQAMKSKGVDVLVLKADVSQPDSLEKALKRHLKDMPPLHGVIHAAAVLDDGMISGLTPERLARSLAAKSLGAWNLHAATLDAPLDFFLLFSSATTPFGNPGQAGYVAANCMLEALCAWRRQQGLPAQAIGWGPIDDTGMLTRNPKARQMLLKVLGISPVSSAEAMRWMDDVLTGNTGLSHYFGIDWNNRADLPVLRGPRFSLLRGQRVASQNNGGPSLDDIRACPPKEAVDLICTILLEEVAHVLRMPKDKLAPELSLVSLGMDSLTSVELGLAVEQRFELTGYTLPLSEKTTALSLAQSLHAIVCGQGGQSGQGEQADPDAMGMKQAVQLMAEKHGLHFSQQAEDEILNDLKKR